MDEIAAINEEKWDRWSSDAACSGSRPFLDLSRDELKACVDERTDTAADLVWPATTKRLLRHVAGKDVLCLAGAGGQQSVVLSLLGARVTVFDLSAVQLSKDQTAAEHYGYEVRTIQGDMRDLTVFEGASFDCVCQPISICFVPDVRPVYAEVARVMRRGGLYEVAHVNPATYPVSFERSGGWDGSGYRITEPYVGGSILRMSDGRENMHEGEITGEFRHLMRDIFGGLIECGFSILDVSEDPRHIHHTAGSEPGSEEHMHTVVAQYFAVLARKAQS